MIATRVLYSSTLKVKWVYLNSNAEILMGSCSERELFRLAISYAPKSFGYKKTLLDSAGVL